MRRALIIVGVALARTALADPTPAGPRPIPAPAPAPAPPPASEKVDAKALMQLGIKLLKSKDYLGALAVFKDAYSRFPSPRILLNIGTTLKLLDRNAEAANTYQRYLDSSDADADARASVATELVELDKGLARLAVSAPPEAELQIDTEGWIPSAQAKSHRVMPGKYEVHARRDGYKPFETSGDIALGQEVAVTVTLEEIPKQRPVFVRVPSGDGDLHAAIEEEPRSRLAALAFGHFDVKGGAAMFVGLSFDVTERLAVHAAGILGPNYGGYTGASFAILTGTLRPMISAGMPIFFNAGARYALRGAAGLEIAASRHFAVIVEVGVEHNLDPQTMVDIAGMPRSITATSFIPAIGATARL